MAEVVTELRCQYTKLVSVSAGNKISKVFDRDEAERKKANQQTDSRKDLSLGVVSGHMEPKKTEISSY